MNPFRFRNARMPLLELHQSLIQAERREYERVHGRIAESAFLNILVQDPAYAWLKPLTALIASIDQLEDDKEFQRRYAEALQRSPEVVMAHSRVSRALSGERA